jgi:tetratricopeptide (TPR) repeat protein
MVTGAMFSRLGITLEARSVTDLQSRLQEALRGRYVIDRQVGMGGMGTVYLAEDLKHHRPVAVKVMRPELANAVDADRFVREIMTAARMTHPGILPVHDSGSHDGLLYFVMPYVDGGSLRSLLEEQRQLPVEQALRFTTDLGEALAYAHQNGVVHRDLKPENILIEAGRPVIADFGVALALGEESSADARYGIAIGTPHYMSPEQATAAEHIDGRTDLYSLASVLYEMLAGDPPFTGPTSDAILARKLTGDIPSLRIVRPTVPRKVEQAITKAVSPIPADRFDSVEHFLDAVRIPALPKGRVFAAVAGATLVAIVAVGWFLGTSSIRIDPNTIVVDQFENLTGDAALATLGISVADWIIEGLQGTRLTSVVPTRSALQASLFVRREVETDASVDPLALLARETQAGLIVSGAYYEERGRVTFHTQVSEAAPTWWRRLFGRGPNVRLRTTLPPVTVQRDSTQQGIKQVRARVLGWLASSQGETEYLAPEIDRSPPTFQAYQQFSEGMQPYVDNQAAAAAAAFLAAYASDTTFVVALLYAALNESNLGEYATADSLLRIVALSADRLNPYHRLWLEFRQALLSQDRPRALRSIRALDAEAPRTKAAYNHAIEAWEDGYLEEALEALQSLTPEIGAVRGYLPYWGALANVHHSLGDYRAALRVARRARDIHADSWWPVGWELAAMAALGDAVEVTQRATEMVESQAGADGVSPAQAMSEAAEELWAHGDAEASQQLWGLALEWYQIHEATEPIGVRDRRGRVSSLYALGRYDEAKRAASVLHDAMPQDVRVLGLLGRIAARQGDSTMAAEFLDSLEALGERPYQFGRPGYQAALIAAVMGYDQRALQLLRRAKAQGLAYGHWVRREMDLDRLRGTRAFEALTQPAPANGRQ